MALFSANPIRSAATAAVIVSIAHFATKLLGSLYAFQLTQMSIAVLTMAALLFMIVMHHKTEGRFMNQSQEEIAVIGIFALLWVVFLIGYKSLTGGNVESSAIANSLSTSAQASNEYASWQDPCDKPGAYCVYEEYYRYY